MTFPALDDAGLPRAGDILAGKYQVEAVLGAGGMGVVVSARHLELGQRVALKLLRNAASAPPEAIARFQREARVLAGIRSEHVVRVHDVARLESGAPYLIMEHLAGTDLDQLLRARGPLSLEDAVDYLLQACEAIAEAHAAGVVHRDLKPANLFLTRRADGSSLVKVLDFGISKLTGPSEGGGAEGNLTSTSEILGSPWYMSPEQLRSFKNVDARTDIWALGVILHRLLTGRQPFDGESLSACITKIIADPPTPVREHRSDLPPELEGLILRCLEKDRSRRIQNVAELASGLLRFAPPRSALSVERILGVLGRASSSVETPLPLSAPVADLAHRRAGALEPSARGSTSAAVTAQTAEPGPPRSSAKRSIVAATAIVGLGIAMSAGFFLGARERTSPVAASPTLGADAKDTPSALVIKDTPPALVIPPASVPVPTATPMVTASAALSAAAPPAQAAPREQVKAPSGPAVAKAPAPAAKPVAKPPVKKSDGLLDTF